MDTYYIDRDFQFLRSTSRFKELMQIIQNLTNEVIADTIRSFMFNPWDPNDRIRNEYCSGLIESWITDEAPNFDVDLADYRVLSLLYPLDPRHSGEDLGEFEINSYNCVDWISGRLSSHPSTLFTDNRCVSKLQIGENKIMQTNQVKKSYWYLIPCSINDITVYSIGHSSFPSDFMLLINPKDIESIVTYCGGVENFLESVTRRLFEYIIWDTYLVTPYTLGPDREDSFKSPITYGQLVDDLIDCLTWKP